MSYNSNFYNNFPPNFNTFHARPNFVPPPPPPPAYFIPPSFPPPQLTDQDFVMQFDRGISPMRGKVTSNIKINEFKENLQSLLSNISNVKVKQKYLQDKINVISEEQWDEMIADIEKGNALITEWVSQVKESDLDFLKKQITKRSVKRLRMKRVKQEKKKEKEMRIKELKEKSRKIDENLQKIKDDINKAKQEEDAKIQADFALREVLHKKHDAKKCIVKLDALMKLYRAKQNTAKGRGEAVSERDAESFNRNIEKLKTLWNQKLRLYEHEELEVRAKLKQDSASDIKTSEKETKVLQNLEQWREFMFGDQDQWPQFDFQGDIASFIAVRSQWDQCINEEGTSLPIGWVIPDLNNL